MPTCILSRLLIFPYIKISHLQQTQGTTFPLQKAETSKRLEYASSIRKRVHLLSAL